MWNALLLKWNFKQSSNSWTSKLVQSNKLRKNIKKWYYSALVKERTYVDLKIDIQFTSIHIVLSIENFNLSLLPGGPLISIK